MTLRWTEILCFITLAATFDLQDDPPITCPIPIITNGFVTNHDNEELAIGETLTVVCGSDYKLSRTEKSVCQSDGSYSPPIPKCNAIECQAPDIKNGRLVPSGATIDPEKSVTVECNAGYILSRSNNKIKCVTNSIFDPFNLPTCNAQNCDENTVVPNGKITGPTPYISPGSKLLIQCSQGYKEVDMNITCVTLNKFDPEDGISKVCVAQDCVIPTVPNGSMKDDKDNALQPNDKIAPDAGFTITCEDQYRLDSGNARATCVTLNIFNPATLPQCMAQDCPERTITHGTCPSVKPNQIYQITCNTNYKLSTTQEFTCVSGNKYIPADQTFPSCEPKDCPLEAIDNGEITGELPLKPGETATLKCGNDYNLVGDPVIQCVAGTVFAKELPRCAGVACPVPKIDRGSIPGYPEGGKIPADERFNIQCNEPYALSDVGEITCITKNTFNPNTLPTCKRTLCIEPKIEHGRVTGPSTIAPNRTLTIQCDTGYVMSHNDPVKCYSKNKFYIDPPTCDAQNCPRPSDNYVTNGRFKPGQPEQISPGQKFTIECSENYLLEGSNLLTCESGTVFTEKSYPKCNPKPCRKSDFVIPNGRITNAEEEIEASVIISVECDTDYRKVGQDVSCVAGNQASGELPTCTGYDCVSADLPSILNADYDRVTYKSGQNITVTCHNGYMLVPGSAVCLTKRNIKGDLPKCVAQSCTVDDFKNGKVIDNGKIPPKSNIKIECDTGYELSDTTRTFRCVTDRVYDPQVLPVCSAVPCPVPDIKNSIITNSNPIPIEGRLNIACKDNYLLSDNSAITCVSGSVFSKDLPTCNPIPCSKPDIVNGRVDTTSLTIPVNGEVRVICNDQYKPSHTDIPICITNNTFSPPLPTCNDKDCGIPNIANGSVTGASSQTVSPGVSLTVQCDSGYNLDSSFDGNDGAADGRGKIQCVRANTFNPALPSLTCIPQPCPIPTGSKKNATILPEGVTEIQPGLSLTIKCHSRYQIEEGKSEQIVKCVAADTYYPPAPVCQAKSCPPPTIQHGTAGTQPITPLEKLVVTCDDGYDLSVSPTANIRCYADNLFTADNGKTWSTDLLPTCNPRNCLKSLVAVPKFGRVENTEEEIRPSTDIRISCQDGYKITPASAVQCVTRNDNGLNVYSGTGKLPVCAAQACPLPANLIKNGYTNPSVSEVQPGQAVIYTCNSGYSTNDTAPLLCVTSNHFSTPYLPVCRENCNRNDELIPNGYISGPGTLKTGQEITIACNKGYVKKDPSEVVKCITREEYSPAKPQGCKAVPCPVPSIRRAIIENIGTIPVNENLKIYCEEHYRLTTGSNSIVCESGSVFQPDISTVKCVEMPCILTPDSIVNGIVRRPDNMPGEQDKYEYTHNAPLRYSCKEGYVSSTTQDSFCDTNTIWRPALPKCLAQRCNAPNLGPGVITTPRILDPGQVVTVQCPDGKVPSFHPDLDKFKCVTENQFSITPLPQCEARKCPAPNIPHSNYDGTGFLAPGSPLDVKCDGNYTLVNPDGYSVVSCVSTDHYTTTNIRGETLFPLCKARNCGKPVIPNGIVSTLDVIVPGSSLELNCGTGYVTPPVNTFKCVSYEIYDPPVLPRCGTTDCVIPNSFEHGTINSPINPGDELQVKCDRGYAIDCNETFTCVTGTVFNPNSKLPQCKPKLCEKQEIKNGNITGPDPITPDSILTIQCVAGKAITSHIMPKCIHTTVFEPPVSGMECIDARNCEDWPEIQHGSLSSRSVAPGQYAQLTCNSGYKPTPADGRVFCVVGGMSQPFYPAKFGCDRIKCNLPEIKYGYLTNVELYQGDQLDVQCKATFYNPYSSVPIRCVEGDTFSVNQPFSCLPVETCPIPTVTHGKVTQTTLPIGTAVGILCDPGYYDPYSGDVKCTMAGTISHSNIVCQTCNKTIENTDGKITSPLFESSNYPPNVACTYTIRAKEGKHVRVILESVDLERSLGCTKDSLSFYDGEEISVDKLIYTSCGSEGVVKRAVKEIESSSSIMTIRFVSDGEGGGTGFRLGYAAFTPGGLSAGVIAAAVIVPLIVIIILIILLIFYLRYWKSRKESYEPHKNFHWKDGGAVDNAYFHFIANGGRKPPPSMASKLQVTAQLPEDETDSVVSSTSRSRLTDKPTLYYSDLKLSQTPSPSRPHSRQSKRTPLAPTNRHTPNSTHRSNLSTHRSNLSPHTGRSNASSNFNSRELENMEKYNHKKSLEGLGLTEADFKLNIPASYTGRSNASLTESDDDSLARTALEDTLMDGDPLQHTILSDDVLRSPQTMRALAKFRAGARKERYDDPNDENYEMKRQNRALTEEQLVHQRRAYNAGYRRPLPPSQSNL